MNNDKNQEFFSKKSVEEQIERLSAEQMGSSSSTSSADKAEHRLLQDLARYRLERADETQQALQRAWQRIAAKQATQEINLPGKNQATERISERVTAPIPLVVWRNIPKSLSTRHKPLRRYLKVATLVALLLLVIGSTALITQSMAYYHYYHQAQTLGNTKTTQAPTTTSKRTTTSIATKTSATPTTAPTSTTPVQTQTVVSTPTIAPANVPGNAPVTSGNSTLLASDMFDGSGVLNGASEGTGWSNPWDVQNGDTSVPGYTIESSNPLSYSNLQSTNTYATGGSQYLTAGHLLDTSSNGPFAPYLTNGVIGNSGTSLWLSILLRKETDDDQPAWVSLNNEQIDWCATCTNQEVNIGYFGSPSEAQGTRYWSLQLGGTVYRSAVPVILGQTALLVLNINFGATTQCQLYVDPGSLGGPAPGASSAQASIATDLFIHNLDYYGGNTFSNSSLADVRIGTSYAAVTPTS